MVPELDGELVVVVAAVAPASALFEPQAALNIDAVMPIANRL
jgi:hypothetical protein